MMIFLIDPTMVGKKCPSYEPPVCSPKYIPLYGIDPILPPE
ncbi:MAG: hypothetical protein AB1483_11990 [Candidatus Zixiibacteriota bacterium]